MFQFFHSRKVDDLDELSNKTNDLIRTGQWDEAEKVCQRLREQFPEELDADARLAQLHQAQQNYAKALPYAQAALDKARNNPDKFDPELFEIGVPFFVPGIALPDGSMPRMKTIIVDGLTVIEESDAAAGTEYIQVHGEVERLMVNNATVLRAPGLKPAGTLVAMKEGGKIGTLHLSHVHVEGLETLVANEERIARTLSHQVENGAGVRQAQLSQGGNGSVM